MPFPTGAELAQFLVDSGVLASVPGDLSAYVSMAEAARLDWERDTGWSPWLGTAETRYYDPNGSTLLDPGVGILSISCLKLGGTEQTLNEDYWLLPYNGFPKRLISFDQVLCGDPRSIEITGTWGYQSELTQDVVRAALARGALLAVAQDYGLGGLKQEVEEGDVRYKLAKDESQLAQWRSVYEQAVARHRRVGLAL